MKIQIKDDAVEVQGPKGKMRVAVPQGISLRAEGRHAASPSAKQKSYRALHGLARALVANAVTGVTTGFKKDLDIVGVGYRAEVKGKNVVLALGYSHPIEFPIPEGIQIAVEKQTHMTVSGADKGQVGPGCRQHARAAPARSVQAEGRAHHRRASQEESGQGGRQDVGCLG